MKHTIATMLRSLFSNQAVIDCRKNKWWLTLIVFVLAVFIPWMPSLITGYTSNTASLLTATSNYEIDKGFKSMIESDYFQNISIVYDNENPVLSYDLDSFTDSTSTFDNETNGDNVKTLYKATFEDDGIGGTSENPSYLHSTAYCATTSSGVTHQKYDYFYDCISVSDATQVNTEALSTSTSSGTVVYENTGRTTYLEAFYIPSLVRKDNDKFLNNFITSVVVGLTASNTATRYPHSYTIWGKDFIVLAVFPLRSSLSSLSASASYEGNVSEGLKNQNVASGTKLYTYLAGKDTSITTIYNDGFVSFMHEAGRPAYLRSVWLNILILSAATVGSMLVAGVALFIFSRRKTSIYRDTTFFQALWEGVYLVLCPAILGALIALFSSTYTMIVIIGASLMRIVFMMNRICPPPESDSQNGNKPLYQARD